MNQHKIEVLKNTIADAIKSDFIFKINEVLSICDSEIEKLLILQFYNYFQNYGKQQSEQYCYFDKIHFIENEILLSDFDISLTELEIIDLVNKVKKHNYRYVHPMHYKYIGFKVVRNQTEGISIEMAAENPNLSIYDDIVREFSVYPQYETIVQGKKYIIDIAIILNRFQDGKIIDTRKIALECDGYDYHSSPQQKRDDDIRTRKLKVGGWKEVFRYSGTEIYHIKNSEEVHYKFEDIVELLML